MAIVTSLLAILIAGATSFVAIRNTNRIGDTERADADSLRASTTGSCRRVNVLRRQVNHDAETIWLVLQAAARSTSSARARRVYLNRTNRTTWGPPTDCAEAVEHPLTYRPPTPRHFPR